jgi:Family of unknown function (DUF5681)
MTTDSDGEGRDKSSGRFQPGQSGNRRGRPKKPKTVGAAITGAFAEKVPISEGGKRRKITKLEAAAKQIANKSASGDSRSAKLGLDLAQKAEERQSRSSTGPTKLSETDSQIAERLMARLRQTLKDETNEHDSDPTDA